MAEPCDPIQCNSEGLECFANGDPEAADILLRKAYRNLADETGILVNLGLALMQQGLVDQAERAYRLALNSDEATCSAKCCQKSWLFAALARRPSTRMALAWPTL